MDPYGNSEFTQEHVANLRENVDGLNDAYVAGQKPTVDFDLVSGEDGARYNNRNISMNKASNKTNYRMASNLFHEYRHAWQYMSDTYTRWVQAYGYYGAELFKEFDAYKIQILMGDQGGSIFGEQNKNATNFNNYMEGIGNRSRIFIPN
jgi:hypothetical protein